jgi:hypothetical protein
MQLAHAGTPKPVKALPRPQENVPCLGRRQWCAGICYRTGRAGGMGPSRWHAQDKSEDKDHFAAYRHEPSPPVPYEQRLHLTLVDARAAPYQPVADRRVAFPMLTPRCESCAISAYLHWSKSSALTISPDPRL